MLTLSLVLILVLHSKGSTVNRSLIASDMPSALGLVLFGKGSNSQLIFPSGERGRLLFWKLYRNNLSYFLFSYLEPRECNQSISGKSNIGSDMPSALGLVDDASVFGWHGSF